MTVESLSSAAQAVIRKALAFVATTRQLDGELETRLGVERGQLAEILMRWPSVSDQEDDTPATLAINNALNEVARGLDLSTEDWRQLDTTRAEVESAYVEWATSSGWNSIGLR
jgi:hypothetical protein